MTADALYLVQLHLDLSQLVRHARARGMPLRELDPGYLIHAALASVFGEGSLKPWSMRFDAGATDRAASRRVRLLAYSTLDAQALQERAALFAEPSEHAAIDWSQLATKPMPATFREGQRLGFEVRACPTVRQGKREVDAFLAEVEGAGEDPVPPRHQVYASWLSRRAEGHGIELLQAEMTEFRLVKMHRRKQGTKRTANRVVLPEVVLRGELVVQQPADFASWLRRGVGRHRAFGYGMLLLRPPS